MTEKNKAWHLIVSMCAEVKFACEQPQASWSAFVFAIRQLLGWDWKYEYVHTLNTTQECNTWKESATKLVHWQGRC